MIINFNFIVARDTYKSACRELLESLPKTEDYNVEKAVFHHLDNRGLIGKLPGEGVELMAESLATMCEADIVRFLSDAAGDTLRVTIPGRKDCVFITARELNGKLIRESDYRKLISDALRKGVWETGADKSEYNVEEFNGPFRVGFDWNNRRHEFEIDTDKLDLEQDEDTWFHYEDAGRTEDGNHVTFEVWGTKDVFGNIRTSGPCLVHGSSVRTACVGVNVTVNGNVEEQVDDVDIL